MPAGLDAAADAAEEQRVPSEHHQPVQLPALPAAPPQLQPQQAATTPAAAAALRQDQQAQAELQQAGAEGGRHGQAQVGGLRGSAESGEHLPVPAPGLLQRPAAARPPRVRGRGAGAGRARAPPAPARQPEGEARARYGGGRVDQRARHAGVTRDSAGHVGTMGTMLAQFTLRQSRKKTLA